MHLQPRACTADQGRAKKKQSGVKPTGSHTLLFTPHHHGNATTVDQVPPGASHQAPSLIPQVVPVSLEQQKAQRVREVIRSWTVLEAFSTQQQCYPNRTHWLLQHTSPAQQCS